MCLKEGEEEQQRGVVCLMCANKKQGMGQKLSTQGSSGNGIYACEAFSWGGGGTGPGHTWRCSWYQRHALLPSHVSARIRASYSSPAVVLQERRLFNRA